MIGVLSTFSSMAGLEIVKITIPGAASDGELRQCKVNVFSSLWETYEYLLRFHDQTMKMQIYISGYFKTIPEIKYQFHNSTKKKKS